MTKLTHNNIDQSSHTLQDNIPDEVKTLVDHVFKQLSVIFPGWRATWRGATEQETAEIIKMAKKEWTKGFFENNINSTAMIKHGLEKARASESDFLPSCGKFIAWCKPCPADYNIPLFEKTYRALVASDWFHPIVYEMKKRISSWDLSHLSDADLRKTAKATYQGIIAELSEGMFEFEKPAEKTHHVEHHREPVKKLTMTREEAMAEMSKILGTPVGCQK